MLAWMEVQGWFSTREARENIQFAVDVEFFQFTFF